MVPVLARTAAKYPYDRIVSNKFPLTEINEAFAAQDKGAITRSTLVP